MPPVPTKEQLRDITRVIDSLVIEADDFGHLYRKLDTLHSNGDKAWMMLRAPVWKGDKLIAVVIRPTKDYTEKSQ